MLDRDLAVLYDVETRAINQAVKRNMGRFPTEFCFQLSDEEFENWKSQIVISNEDKMGLRTAIRLHRARRGNAIGSLTERNCRKSKRQYYESLYSDETIFDGERLYI